MKKTFVLPMVLGVLTTASGPALAADPVKTQPQAQEQIYGSQLMTPQERAEYQTKMHAAKTAEERERIRAEHHTQMQERAKVRGVTLPDKPPAMGGGMGSGGMGPGGGMGSGGKGSGGY